MQLIEGSPATETRSTRVMTSVRARLRAAYEEFGLLVPLSVLAIAGGAWLQHAYEELPGQYTWLQPFRTLHAVAHLPWLPSAAGLAYLLGSLARRDPAPRSRSRLLESLRDQPTRRRTLLRLLTALVAILLDTVFVPSHTPFDALALGCFAAVLVRRYSLAELLRSALYVGCSVLVFTSVCYWYTVVKALTFVGSFTQRDQGIVAFEHAITGFHPYRAVAAWSAQHPNWVWWFDWAYGRLFHHMTVAAAFFFGLRDAQQRTEYLGALALCYFVGGPLYWLLPAAGPAYFSPKTYLFLRSNPALQVNWMQAVLYQNTGLVNQGKADLLLTWSYIACMPSLHMAHETVMLYYARASKWFFGVSLAFSLLTAVAVVALGWHYPTDVLGGVLLAVAAILFCRWQSRRLLPRAATGGPRSSV